MFGFRQKMSHHYGKIKEIPGKASQQVEEYFEIFKLILIKLLIAGLTISILCFLSFFLYGMFYFSFVPAPEHEGQIYLQFEPCNETPGRCGFLNGSLQLSRRNQVLMPGQPYTVSVQLQMPESTSNRNAGMFMACAQLKTRESQIIRHNCKSSMLQYRSDLLRVIDTFVFLPGLLTGHLAEKQVVDIEFFDSFFDDPLSPAILLDVQINSRFVEIYSTSYRIHANFSGLRYFMFYYPLTSAVIGSSLNMLLLSVLFLLSWYKLTMTKDQIVVMPHAGTFNDPFLVDATQMNNNETKEKEDKDEVDKEVKLSNTEEEEDRVKSKLNQFLDKEEEKALQNFVILPSSAKEE